MKATYTKYNDYVRISNIRETIPAATVAVEQCSMTRYNHSTAMDWANKHCIPNKALLNI